LKHAVHLPPVGEFADPRVQADLAVAAEECGWDGFFLWDHLLRPPTEPPEVADTFVALAAVASATSRIRLGPMVTPLARYGPQRLARACVTLDHLSAGRLTLGLGLGHDRWGELRPFGEPTDPRERAELLDEGVEVLTALWSGEDVRHRGRHYVADRVRFLPVPVQRPRIPLWFAARGDARRPVRRAARYEGLFPVDVSPDQLGRMLDIVIAERSRGGTTPPDKTRGGTTPPDKTRGGTTPPDKRSLEGFDVAVSIPPGGDPEAYAALGVTWVMWAFQPADSVTAVRAVIEAGGSRGE
jgi:alkanesulfonate monooxygenase SsuD/methylene tetrahydromethanopterin reductase-like flavin-dependent oxidoreductase (luciferase family)